MMSSLSPCFSAKPRVTIMAKPASLFASMMACRQAFCAAAGLAARNSASTPAHHFPIRHLPYSEICSVSCQPSAAGAMRLVSRRRPCWLCRRFTRSKRVKQVEVGCIGVGWIGGLRAETLARSALVDRLHLCDIKPDRLAEVKAAYKPATATLDYNDIINNPNISVVFISTTPEANHYPICRDCLKGGKNVMLEKPIALELWEADELIMLAKRNNLKFTIGYSQRFNTKIAFAKKKITCWT